MDAAGRNERRLMRQRGAGTRNINNNIDFGLSFPTPINARHSKTPYTDRRVSVRATKTPARRSVSQEPTAAIPTLPEAATVGRPSKRKSSFLDAVTDGPAPSTGKKRRLNGMTETPLGQNDQGSSHLGGIRQSITRQRASRRADTIAIAEEASDGEDAAPVHQVGRDIVESQEEPLLDDQEDKENDEPNIGPLQGQRKKRKSVARRFSKPKKRSSTGSLQGGQVKESREIVRGPSTTRDEDPATPSSRPTLVAKDSKFPLIVRHQNGVAIPTKAPRSQGRSTAIEDTAPPTNARTTRTRESPASTEDGDPDAEDSILSLQNDGPSKKRRKRKSITVLKKSKRRPSAQYTASSSPVQRPQRPQPRTASPTATPYQEPIENEDQTYIPEEVSPEPPTPAIPKRRRRNARIRSIESDNLVPHRHRSTSSEPRSGFPITTHRLVNTSALPTITEENEHSNSDHDLDQVSTFFARAAPNAVDVLAQICRESVASALISIRSIVSGSGLKRKTEALESFGRELESRLFDMSAAVENRLTLESRVRGSKRENSAMQSRWVEVRRQREEVALRMDAARREHWEGEERGAQSWRMSEACFGVGMVIEREKGTEMEGLEGLLGSVGRDVSGFEGGGTLQKVKEFNAMMERMVHVLEGGTQ